MKKKVFRSAAMMAAAMSIACTAQVFAADVNMDVNGDGACNMADAVVLASYLSGMGDAPVAGDLDGDGRINAKDLTLLKRTLINPQQGGNEGGEEQPTPDDTYVTAITYGASGVTLKNAAEAEVPAEKASNVTVEGTKVTITQPTDAGDVNVDGECGNGQLVVDVDKEAYPEGQVTVNLRGLTLTNENDSPIYVAAVGDEFVLTVKNETVNTISDGVRIRAPQAPPADCFRSAKMRGMQRQRGYGTFSGKLLETVVLQEVYISYGAAKRSFAACGRRQGRCPLTLQAF